MDWRCEYPHNYLFRLEEANLTKDEGNGPGAIALYKEVLADAAKPGYFVDPRLQMAWFGLADTQRGQNDIADAAENYLKAAEQPELQRLAAQARAVECRRDVRSAAPEGEGGGALPDGVVGRRRPVAGGDGAAVDEDAVCGEVGGARF